MTNFIATNGPSGAAGGHIDETALQNTPARLLLDKLGSSHALQGDKMLFGEELQRRLDAGEIGKDLTPEEKEEAKKLLDSAKNGTISPDGAERLTQLLQPSQTAGHDKQDIR